jgi:hypothetical protein
MSIFQLTTMLTIWIRLLFYSIAITTALLWIDLPTLAAAFLIIYIVRITLHSLPVDEQLDLKES